MFFKKQIHPMVKEVCSKLPVDIKKYKIEKTPMGTNKYIININKYILTITPASSINFIDLKYNKPNSWIFLNRAEANMISKTWENLCKIRERNSRKLLNN